jgi:hypothetical protein
MPRPAEIEQIARQLAGNANERVGASFSSALASIVDEGLPGFLASEDTAAIEIAKAQR